MPKIEAPTVREHHAMVKARLIAATEAVLREKGPNGLSAGAVAEQAGIARNSIYRYVDSVDDLKLLALEQHLPRWSEAVFSRIDAQADPTENLARFAVACLYQTQDSSHGFLMSLMRTSARQPHVSHQRAHAQGQVKSIHAQMFQFIRTQWAELGVTEPDVWTGYVWAIIFDSFGQVEAGVPIEKLAGPLHDSVRALASAAATEKVTHGEN